MINLYERLNLDRRSNYYDTPDYDHNSFLLVIDKYSIREQHWSKINHQKLGVYGIYNLWRIKKDDLKTHANQLVSSGFESNWQNTKAEKF